MCVQLPEPIQEGRFEKDVRLRVPGRIFRKPIEQRLCRTVPGGLFR